METNFGDLAFQAEGGSAEAQYRMGIWFLLGEPVEQDLEASFQWLAKAAAGDHPDAQSLVKELARCRPMMPQEDKSSWSQLSGPRLAKAASAFVAGVRSGANRAVRLGLSRLPNLKLEQFIARISLQPREKALEYLSRLREAL